MADVNIQQTPPDQAPRGGGGGGAAWAVVVVVLIAVIAWLVFGGGIHRTSTYRADVKITPPSAPAPSAPSPSGGSAGGNVSPPPGGSAKPPQ
jgi:hypothetical protein